MSFPKNNKKLEDSFDTIYEKKCGQEIINLH